MKKKILLVLTIFGVAITAASFNIKNDVALAAPGSPSVVLPAYNNSNQTSNYSSAAILSANGKWAVATTTSTNAVSGDTNAVGDVFIRNLLDNTTQRITGPGGVQPDGVSVYKAISETGRYIVFASSATNLTSASITSVNQQLYLHDQLTDTNELISMNMSGAPANGNTASYSAKVSADGRYVAFSSAATDLTSDSLFSSPSVFMRDRVENTTTLLSISDAGSIANSSVFLSDMDCDGSLLALRSSASNLVPGDTNGKGDVFLLDLRSGRTMTNITVSADGPYSASEAVLSCNGNYLAFTSGATNLTANVSATSPHVFLKDLVTNEIVLVDQTTTGGAVTSPIPGFHPRAGGVSDRGDVVFRTESGQLISGVSGQVNYVRYSDGTIMTTNYNPTASFGGPTDTGAGNSIGNISARGDKAIAYTSRDSYWPHISDSNHRGDALLVEL